MSRSKKTEGTVASVEHGSDTVKNATHGGVVVLRCATPLNDAAQQAGLFQDLPQGRYIIEYNQGQGVVLPLPVYWTGTEVIA